MDKKQFQNWVLNFGQISSGVLLLLMLLFPVAVSVVFNLWPDPATMIPATITVVLLLAPWWPGECIGYMTTLGPGALYMAYITGNVSNLRVPATLGTISSLNMEPNTDECHTMAIIACGASNFTTIIILAIGLVLSVPLQPVLNAPALQPAFNYAIPALFGGLVAQNVLKTKKSFLLYLIPLAICLFFCYFTKVAAAYYMLVTVFAGAAAYYFLDYKRGKKSEETK